MMTIGRDAIAKGGSRNTTLALMAGALPGMGRLDHAMVDQTGLTGRWDFAIEFTPERPDGAPPPEDAQAPTFIQALREQLGLKLESIKAQLPLLTIDHVERPTEN
jgi:uncharacterized protein (TIGR03435 family)